jgi:putative membrane protein
MTINRTTSLAAAAAVFLLPAAALAQVGQAPTAQPASQPAQPGVPITTATFLEKVAAGNTFEIESSRLAMTKATNASVKSFAQQMVTDHTEAGSKFKAAVSEADLKAPPEKTDAKHTAIVEKLKGLQGVEFDQAYITAQREAHVETVALFEAYAATGENARLKKFANELLPVLRSHLEHVNALKAS